MRIPKFIGVYSRKDTGKKGREARIPMYFAWRLSDGSYAVQELDQAYNARGGVAAIPAPAFEAVFKLEPSILAVPVITPDFTQVSRPSRKQGSGEDQTALALARQARQVEADLRDGFAKALRALARPRDRKAAMASLERIAAATRGIVVTHKHMFRDFGVALRKKSLPRLALSCARRAVELSPNDDHARFNLARILGILGRYDDAEAELKIARKLDPNEKVYGRLERHLARERARAETGDLEL